MSKIEDQMELDSRRAELKAEKLELQADRAEFRAMQLLWEATKGSGIGSPSSAQVATAKLEAERLQLEAEKTQMRLAHSMLKAAQSQLVDAESKFEAAQKKMEEARDQLETARRHLTAAKAQTDIDNMRLEASKARLDAAEMRFESATNRLKDAKSKFEAVAATTVGSGISSARLEEENAKLQIQLKKSRAQSKRLRLENSQLKKEVVDGKSKLEELIKENKSLQVKNKRRCERVTTPVSSGNPKVFMDIEIKSEAAGRIIFELFADTTPRAVENFRAFCTGEKGVSPKTGKPLHFKGMSIFYVTRDMSYAFGGSEDGETIYGRTTLPSENFIRKHTGRGDLSLNSCAEDNCYGGYFQINYDKNSQWDGVDVVIGRIVEGLEVLHLIFAAFPGLERLPSGSILIADCGQLS